MEIEQMEAGETIETIETMTAADSLVERLSAAAAALEHGLERMESRYSEISGEVQRIVATVDGAEGMLERRIAELEQKLEQMQAQASRGAAVAAAAAVAPTAGRKTLPASTMALLSKQGISASEGVDAGALDAALKGLNIEQRIAVKSQLLRAGLIS